MLVFLELHKAHTHAILACSAGSEGCPPCNGVCFIREGIDRELSITMERVGR